MSADDARMAATINRFAEDTQMSMVEARRTHDILLLLSTSAGRDDSDFARSLDKLFDFGWEIRSTTHHVQLDPHGNAPSSRVSLPRTAGTHRSPPPSTLPSKSPTPPASHHGDTASDADDTSLHVPTSTSARRNPTSPGPDPPPKPAKSKGSKSRKSRPTPDLLPTTIVKRETSIAIHSDFTVIAEKSNARKKLENIDSLYPDLMQWFHTNVFSPTAFQRVAEGLRYKTWAHGEQEVAVLNTQGTLSESTEALLLSFRRAVFSAESVAIEALSVGIKQCERICETHRLFHKISAECQVPGSPLQAVITEYCATQRLFLKQGVGYDTLTWRWLLDKCYDAENLPSDKIRNSLQHLIRDQVNTGGRLSRLRELFGPGIWLLLPPNAPTYIRRWRIDVFNGFVNVFSHHVPALRELCEAANAAYVSKELPPPHSGLQRIIASDDVHDELRALAGELQVALQCTPPTPPATDDELIDYTDFHSTLDGTLVLPPTTVAEQVADKPTRVRSDSMDRSDSNVAGLLQRFASPPERQVPNTSTSTSKSTGTRTPTSSPQADGISVEDPNSKKRKRVDPASLARSLRVRPSK